MKKDALRISESVLSLNDLLGKEYVDAVVEARAALEGVEVGPLKALAAEKVDFYPERFRERCDALLERVGKSVVPAFSGSARGAGTLAFQKATTPAAAPLSGMGFIRVGEDGRAYLIAKSEHYHAPLGHQFPGYRLLDYGRKIGLLNVTHNNTRGHLTRTLEETLVRIANGLDKNDRAELDKILTSEQPHVLNRVINLETGSLAMEAALKMMLARFYRLDGTFQSPRYQGRTPVFLVIADNKGGTQANYHGTTVLTQTLRGMWPELTAKLEEVGAFAVRSVRINDLDDFRKQLERYDSGAFKVAGFFHEIILMNYGGIRLTEAYLKGAHALCRERDVPIAVDEIQSCMWYPELFLYKQYGLKPDFVSIGKGFPGGQYPASKILTTAEMDNLNQFGALVTNGQEELASLAYLITIAFAEANAGYIDAIGAMYERASRDLAARYPQSIDKVEGQGHLTTFFFREADKALAFCERLRGEGIDISAQTYKADCPPAALTKIPIIATQRMVDFLIGEMDAALKAL